MTVTVADTRNLLIAVKYNLSRRRTIAFVTQYLEQRVGGDACRLSLGTCATETTKEKRDIIFGGRNLSAHCIIGCRLLWFR